VIFDKMQRGFFIVVEGMDGSGKSTQTQILFKHLKQELGDVIFTFNPTSGPIGKLLTEQYLKHKDLPTVDAFLFCADRAEHVKEVILPALENKMVVVCDRYYHSTLAYQQTQGLPLQWLIEMNSKFPKPDLTIFVDVPPEVCMERMEKDPAEKRKPDNRMKFEKLEFLKKLRVNYLQLPNALKNEKIVIIDGNRSMEEVHADIVKEVEKLF
jgi:dTMP kinase